ncbi:hypothetical protein, partial [uncultured Ruminococcus sp.]|uniref:hypothetical protein n=1 Tax=uncultured Ruminococcus sp. TaxID=165186 RepID=UPI002594CCC4
CLCRNSYFSQAFDISIINNFHGFVKGKSARRLREKPSGNRLTAAKNSRPESERLLLLCLLGNTAQRASGDFARHLLANFPSYFTKMLVNTSSIHSAFCFI